MQNFDLGIAYFHSQKARLENLSNDSPEVQQIKLTFEQLVENEDRYKARADFLLKNNLLQMQFGNYRIEYYICDSYVTFSYSVDQGMNYLETHTMLLNGDVGSDIQTIVNVIAQGEAQLLLAD